MNIRQAQEENELIRLENDELRKAVRNTTDKAHKDVVHAEHEGERRANEVLGKFRMQSQIQDENLQIIKVEVLY
jgi:regulator of replication initiation timing